ncbi:hypothetical protein D3C76_1268450 [compost metagenome]
MTSHVWLNNLATLGARDLRQMTVSVHTPFDFVEAFTQRLATFLCQETSQLRRVLTQTHGASVEQFCTITGSHPGPFALSRFGRSDDRVQFARGGLSYLGKNLFGCRVFNWNSRALALDKLAIVVNVHC